MLVLQLIALGLLFHEAVFISSKGFRHLTDNTAPVFGLHLRPSIHIAVHLAIICTNIYLLLFPQARFAPAINLLLLSLLIASFPRRLSNHLIIAWFFLLSFTIDRVIGISAGGSVQDSFALGMIQTLTILTYLIAGFHKLNRDFFDAKKSCGSGLLVHYLLQKGIHLRRWPRFAETIGIYSIIIAEILLPFLLIFDDSRFIGVMLGLALHAAFGFLAHIHFSIIMYAGLMSFYPKLVLSQAVNSLEYLGILVAASVILGHILGNYRPYRWRFIAWVNHILFSNITTTIGYTIIFAREQDVDLQTYSFHSSIYPFLLIMTGFLINGLAPYMGWKFDFSLAMFSNLRPDRSNHYIIRRPMRTWLPRYITIFEILELPTNESDRKAVLLAFERLFPFSSSEYYSIGYFVEALKEIGRQIKHGGYVTIYAGEVNSGKQLKISTADADMKLSFLERLSVYPYALPSEEDIPLCH